MKKSNIKTPVIFFVAIGVLCATLVSFSLTGGLYAKYSTVSYASDSARVAKYSVTVTDLTANELTLDSYDPEALDGATSFTVSWDCEVAVRYGVSIEFQQAVPDYVTVTLDGQTTDNVDAMSKVFTYNNVQILEAGSGQQTHTVGFEVAPGFQDRDIDFYSVYVRVYAEQID